MSIFLCIKNMIFVIELKNLDYLFLSFPLQKSLMHGEVVQKKVKKILMRFFPGVNFIISKNIMA